VKLSEKNEFQFSLILKTFILAPLKTKNGCKIVVPTCSSHVPQVGHQKVPLPVGGALP
jgi:hypothetical protein